VVRDVESVGDMVRLESAQTRFVFTLVATFGTLALLVSTMGLYGLLAQEVARQRREIGVRLALGASRGAMGRRIVGRGLLVTLMGLGAGLSLAVAAVDVIRSQLYSVSPFDVPSVVAACGALVVAALIASVWPAVRAMRVEPAELLRSE
jgi:ABC-type antimicrobial peptide transport system permease subunit